MRCIASLYLYLALAIIASPIIVMVTLDWVGLVGGEKEDTDTPYGKYGYVLYKYIHMYVACIYIYIIHIHVYIHTYKCTYHYSMNLRMYCVSACGFLPPPLPEELKMLDNMYKAIDFIIIIIIGVHTESRDQISPK